VFHGVNCVRALTEPRVAVAATYLADVRVDAGQTGTVGTPKVDPLSGGRWLERNPTLDSQMQPNAFEHH
jgi:hypothetical protein